MRLGRLEATTVQAPNRPARAPFTTREAGTHVMSAVDQGHVDRVAGFLCACSLALSGIALARHPALLSTAAVVVAVVAARMTTAHRTLAAVSVGVASAAFFFGMIIAVLTDNPLY